MEPGGTDGYMNSRGKIGICVECGNHNAPDAKNKALISIEKFLSSFDMIDCEKSEISQIPQQVYTARYAYKTITDSFRVVQVFADFEDVSA